MKYGYRKLMALMAVAAVSGGVMTARGQAGPAVVAGNDSGLLDPELRDDVHGIRVSPPAGSRIAQKAGDEVISFVVDKRQWAGGVRYVFLKNGIHLTLEQYLKSNADAMNQTFKGVSIEKSELIKVGDRQAGRQETAFDVTQEKVPGHPEHHAFFKQDVMIEIGADQFVHLTLFAPLDDKDLAKRTFDQMLSKFQLVNVAEQRLNLQKNAIAGMKWLAPLTADQLAGKLVPGPQYLRILVQDKEFGFVRMDEMEETQGGIKGVCVKVKSYTFPTDGSTLLSSSKAWWAYVLKGGINGEPNADAIGKSSWEALVRSVPAAGVANGDWWQLEKGATRFDPEAPGEMPGHEREKHPTLYLTVETEQGADKAMDVSRALPSRHGWAMDETKPKPLPKALEFMWPRLVDLSKASEMSFPVYNPGTQKLGTRTLSVLGEETVILDGKSIKAVHLTDELDSGATSIWVDKQGRTLIMKTSDGATLLPATQEQMEAKYGDRLRKSGLGG